MIQQLKEVSTLARLTTVLRTIQQNRFVDDLHLSPGWTDFHNTMGNAIALSYCSDGFNPFHHIVAAGSYSMSSVQLDSQLAERVKNNKI